MSSSRLYAHRGLWNERGIKTWEPNSKEAIVNATSHGFAVETDIRDYLGEVIVSHDPVSVGNFSLKDLLQIKGKYALNVKSDGLSPLLDGLRSFDNYFLFDMSVPEYQKLLKSKLKIFGRISEYEVSGQYEQAAGFWVDGFFSDWWCTPEKLEEFSQTGLQYVFVSPELHGRNPELTWRTFAPYFRISENFALCTDHPDLFMELI